MRLTRPLKYKKPVEIFPASDLEKIHLASIEILETIGAKYFSDRVLQLFKGKGAEVDFDKKIVKIGREMVNYCTGKAPHSFSLYTQKFDEMRIGEGEFYFVSTIDNSSIIDPDSLEKRDGRLEDVSNAAKLMDELPFHHICCNAVIAHDIDPGMAVISSAVEIYKNNNKNCLVVPTNGKEAQFIIELGEAVAGSDVNLCEKPVISVSVAPSSPLKFPENSCDVIWEFAIKKLPIIVVHAPVAGANAPVTMAGTMAMANAESLAEIVLIQLINEGSPVVYGGAAVHFDMQYSSTAYGAIEYGMMSMVTAQLGRFYNLPTYGAGGATNANSSDIQCGSEKMSSTLLAYLAGHDMMCDAGLNSNALTSFESILLQDEILNKVCNLSKKINVSDETLAIDVIKSVFHSGDFLSNPHTLKHMKTDFSYSGIAGNREGYDAWLSKGGTDLNVVALNKAKEIIENYEPEPLSHEVNKKINEIVKRAKKSCAGKHDEFKGHSCS